MNRVIKVNKVNSLYIILFFGVFADILRIPGTVITIYRLLMMIGVVVAMSLSPGKICKGLLLIVTFLLFNIIQGRIFTEFVDIIYFIPGYILKYEYFYLCIGITIMMVYAIYIKQKSGFIVAFKRFIYIISVGNILVFLLYIIMGFEWAVKYFTNVNDYGTSLAAFFPILCTDAVEKKKKRYYAFAVLIIILEYINDCKLCCIGILAEIMVIALLYGNRYGKGRRIVKILSHLFVLTIIMMVIYVIASDAVFMGSPIGLLILEPVKRIISLDFYPTSNSSGMFRVNVLIMGIIWTFKSYFIGLGAGSSTMLVKNFLAQYSVYETTALGLSVHNSWLEFLLDFGFIALIIYVGVIQFGIKGVLQLSKRRYYVPAVVCALTIWIWGMQSSGSYTNFGLFTILTYYYIRVKEENKNSGDVL